MNYQQTIAYLYEKLPVFHRVGAVALKPGLENITALCDALGSPQTQFKSIHVGGTNGKGSTSHLLSAILQSAGYKVGLHTSPHLKSYTERFKINGKPCEERVVVDFVAAHKSLIEKIQPSFFEISVALAFDFFAQQNVDIAIIEVGLGGRLDSTNIINPVLSIITNISFDHMDLLGDTLAQISFEKAGIVKAHTPVVISETHPETAPVFLRKAEESEAPIFFADQIYSVHSLALEDGKRRLKVESNLDLIPINEEVEIDLVGSYQIKNVVGIWQSVKVLNQLGFHISRQAVEIGMANCAKLTAFKGRWQVLSETPMTVADVAHNYGGLCETIEQINSYDFDRLHLVLGFVKDKDVQGILPLFPKNATFYFCTFDSPRALSVQELVYIVDNFDLTCSFYRDVTSALEAARQNATLKDFIYVGGSTFVVSELPEI
ncbi:bifunctional folylpolyglutamate synthase/dihydrofolate synthase [Runella slithyformis]|uniref:Dihydrofolate synthase/folylpolyglutamate synthase n=1 Tax=Runella slithyformis (strain ATCC 29530 / DSM 19594 / LMG 11500 / NCIMB 11436 / LSU 4) TaxID=761193 RepID=A0A7U4E854_RUNSL|nr:folylpolyglutamate synthase/dihydrofolate synthase family protein [Runella slithyformis]AEI50894.1 FolC bifunctional protein [Runella slithyformis DSM 19594]